MTAFTLRNASDTTPAATEMIPYRPEDQAEARGGRNAAVSTTASFASISARRTRKVFAGLVEVMFERGLLSQAELDEILPRTP